MNFNYFLRENMDSTNLFNPDEGYNLGNMFVDLYSNYKNYNPVKLVGKTPEERDYLELSRISFAMHEMNLYLDIHPDDRKILQLFNDYRKMFLDLEKKYEEKYGPLTTYSGEMSKTPFAWVQKTWPWEGMNNV